MKSSFFEVSNIMNLAITIDLLIIVPFVYFLLIRKSEIPKTTAVPVMIIGFLIGSYFLPKESQTYLIIFKTWVLPLIEILVFTFVIIKVRIIIKKYKSLKGSTPDFFNTLKNTCCEISSKKTWVYYLPQKLLFYTMVL